MKAFRTISALLLAFLVLMSSTSFMVGMHFCMGEVKSLSLFSAAEECVKQEKPLQSCHKHSENCCQDKVVKHDGDDFKNTLEKLDAGSPVTLELLQSAFIIAENIPSVPSTVCAVNVYEPPSSHNDITISLQVFRI